MFLPGIANFEYNVDSDTGQFILFTLVHVRYTNLTRSNYAASNHNKYTATYILYVKKIFQINIIYIIIINYFLLQRTPDCSVFVCSYFAALSGLKKILPRKLFIDRVIIDTLSPVLFTSTFLCSISFPSYLFRICLI